MSTRILLVDDHTLFREGLRALILSNPGLEIVGESADANEAITLAGNTHPDVVLLDLQMPGVKGLDAARRLLAITPQPRIMILTGSPDMEFVPEAVRLGVLGFLRKDASAGELVSAIQFLMEGKTYLCSEASAAVFHSLRNPGAAGPATSLDAALSDRERQVLALVAKGFRNKEIADQIGTSIKSVETYRSRMMTKLGFNSTAELLRYAVQNGL
jgi:two-component system response regulator NreC